MSTDHSQTKFINPTEFRGLPGIAVNRPQTLILVIDDDAEVLESTVRILEKAGFPVVSGATAAEAFSLTRQHRPALVLLDVVLQDGSGVDAARTLKQDPALADVFIILLSGYRISPEEQAEGLSRGLADGYITRPFTKVDFLARIDAFLRIRAMQEALRQSDMALRALLAEKEVLLKEIHHRVKNNLAAVTGLVDLQGQALADEAGKTAMAELSVRIRSMSLVHEQLYRSDSLSRIDFQDYLETLISHLRLSYDHTGGVQVSVAAAGVTMGLDNAVPCGLFITELITNAYKYAFPNEQSRPGANGCEIAVSASWDGIAYTLAVADNGLGLPEDFNWKTTKTLGLMLVGMLGEHQLQGEVDLDRSNGTMFRLRFEPKRQ